MTWEEAERRIAAGDDPEKVWDCVYLRPQEIAELLEWVKTRPVSPWVYPMFVFAAHTGARRSEIVRALPSDVDLAGGVVTIREKKRDKTQVDHPPRAADAVPEGSAGRLDEAAGQGQDAVLQGRRQGDHAPRGARTTSTGPCGCRSGAC